jgi:hypothetical protein
MRGWIMEHYGIPILHVPAAQAYNADEIAQLVAGKIGSGLGVSRQS